MRKEIHADFLSLVAKLFVVTVFILGTFETKAQTYNHSATAQSTCSGTFYDNNGTLNYTNNVNITQTFTPSVAGNKLRVVFSSFATEDGYDGLVIYNGNSTAAPIISSGAPAGTGNATNCPAGSYYGTDSPGTVTSTAADGSLTFTFRSDALTRDIGWVATIQCISTNTITTSAASYGPFCANTGGNITVNYTSSGTFTGAFRVQVSNVGGAFPANATTNLLNTVSSGTGNITATIPSGTALGAYRVRVVNATPSVVSSNDNGSDIVITAAPPTVGVTPSAATICLGGIQTISSTGLGLGATTNVILGSGAATSTATSNNAVLGPNPFQNYYGGSKQQMLVRAAELTALGMSANGARISDLAIYMAAAGTPNLQNVTIKMQNTTLAQLTASVVSTGWTTVYTAATFTPSAGINNMALATPFDWNGTDNLLIEINYSNNNSPTTATNTATYDNTAYVSTFLYRADNQTAAVMNGYTTSGTASFTYSARNRMRFGFKNMVPPTWTPIAGLYTNAAATAAYTAGTALATVYAKPAATTTYTGTIFSGTCSDSQTAQITVSPVSVGGTVTTSTTVCSGSNSGTLFLNGQTGNVIRWESSLNNFATAGTPIANTTTSLIYTNLTATTSFRAVVQSGLCATANSVSATVTVNPVSVGGTVGNSVTVCSGSNSGSLLVSGHVGNVVRWESSLDAFATAGTPIAVTNTSLNYSNLTATTSYRAVIQSGICATANSDYATVTVNPATVSGAVTGSATVCSGSNSGTLNLGTHTGNIIRWESSSDNFATAGTPIANTTASLNYNNITATTSYRAVVQSGVCAAVGSGSATITVNPVSVGGTVNASTAVCSGSNSGTLTLSGHTGNVMGWESSLDGFATAGTPIANTTTSIAYNNLTATTSYRAIVRSGICASATATFATVTVNPVSVGGAVASGATVCSGNNLGTLTLSGHTGNVIRWESSSDNFATAGTPIANTATSLNYTNITATTSYRAVVQSGACAPANSAAATIIVNAPSVGGVVNGSTTVCATSNSGTLTLSGQTGTVTKWQSSDLSDFSAAVLDIPNTSTTLSFVNISSTTYYRAVVTSGVCAFAYSAAAAVAVEAAGVGGTLSGNATGCYANNSGSLTLSGNSGNVIRWESSLNNFLTTGLPIANTTTTHNYSNLTGTTYYRAVVDGGSCGIVYSSVGVITIDNNTVWVGGNGSAWNDAANWSCGVVPTSDVNVSITAVNNNPVISSDAFAKTLTMDPATTLTIRSGSDLRVVDAINGLGNALITIENNANLIQELDVNNSGNAIVKRASAPILRLDYTLWSSPVTGGQSLLDFSPNTLANRFYIYNPGTDLYNAVTPSSTFFSEGTGYLIRVRNNHQTDTPFSWVGQFSGTLNNGDVNIPVASGTFNAIGNPYPSTIDADAFITENNITEALYFWRKTNDATTTSYATYTLAGGAGTQPNNGGDPNGSVPNGIIQVGQGFIAKSTSNNFNFNNGMRLGNNNNQFFRAAQTERNRIWLNLTNTAGIFSQTMVAYMTGATYGVDAAIDGPYFNDSQVALTSIINSNEYAVQGRSLPFDNTDAVPLGFKATVAGTYTIGLDHADGLFADAAQNIYIKDNLDGSFHDLRSGNYTFASEAGIFNGRFEIVYRTDVLSVENPVWDASQVIVYKQGADVVINSGKVIMSHVKVYDIGGRLLAHKENINASEAKLFTGNVNQVLVVKITSADNREVAKKVMN